MTDKIIEACRKLGYEILFAKKELLFTILEEDIVNGICHDPANCVIAKALRRIAPEGLTIIPEVGDNLTKLIYPEAMRIVIYGTGSKLARNYKIFDMSEAAKLWPDGPGEYRLNPYPITTYKPEPRFKEMRHSGGEKSVWKGERSHPTRHARNIFQLVTQLAKQQACSI